MEIFLFFIIALFCFLHGQNVETMVPLTKFSYGVSEVYTVNGYVIYLTPKVTGTAKKYTISPILKKGSKLTEGTGFLQLTYGSEGNYTITASNPTNSISTSIIIKSGGIASEPAKYLSLGYYNNYQFAVGYPVNIPIYVTGPVILCNMDGTIPGLTFDINGLKGTPTAENLTPTTLSFYCLNGASRTNYITINSIVFNNGFKGLIGNFWKWNRYIKAFPVRTRNYAFSVTGGTLEVRKIVNSITIDNDNYFSFYPDFKSYFGATFTGYINIPESKTYTFSTQSTTGSFIDIDYKSAVDHMTGGAHGNTKKTGLPMYLEKGYHTIILGNTRKDTVAYCRFYWNKNGFDEEISMNDLFYIPLDPIEFEYSINGYSKDTTYNINLFKYNNNINNCKIVPDLTDFTFDNNNFILNGNPKTITTFADYEYILSCNSNNNIYNHTFSIEIRDFDYLPLIPYIVFKRAIDRRVNIDRDMYLQPYWTLDHSCYPARTDFYWNIEKADSIYGGDLSCSGSGRSLKCVLKVATTTNIGATFDPGPEYDQAFQIHGSSPGYFERKEYVLSASILNDPKRSASLLISFTCLETSPIPGWIYLGIWTNGRNWNPLAPSGSNSNCARFIVYNRFNEVIIELPASYPDWLLRQGLLVEPGEYTIELGSINRGGCPRGADFNITFDNQFELINVPWLETITKTYTLRRQECTEVVSENLPITAVGGSVTFDCRESDQYGIITRTCIVDKNGLPFWGPEESTCRKYIPLTAINYGLESIDVPTNKEYIITPAISGDYDSMEITPASSSYKFDSSNGKITFYSISSMSSYVTLTITAKLSSTFTSYSTTLKYKIRQFQTSEDFLPIQNLFLYPSNNVNFVVDATISIPFSASGIIESCKITPDLPSGLLYDFNKIYGRATQPTGFQQYTLQCNNTHSTSNKVIFRSSVLSANSLHSGGLYSYYWYRSSQLDCNIKYVPFITNNILIGMEGIENTIQHPKIDSSKWSSLGPSFTDYWGVLLYGYINLPSSSDYAFHIKSLHGTWIEIDDKEVVSKPGCTNFDDPSTSSSPSYSFSQGRHTIRIYHFHNGGPSGLEIYWKIGSSSETLIPNNNFEYVYPTTLSYTYMISNYVLGERIKDNLPLIVGTVDGLFTIDNELPDGLLFDGTTGKISGTPKSTTSDLSISFIISATISGTKYSATIYISILDKNLPYNVRVAVKDTLSPITEQYLVKGESIILETLNDGEATSYSITSQSLPGFLFDTKNGELSGTCDEEFHESITILAINSAGSSSYSFSLICSNICGAGNEQFLITINNYYYITKGLTMNIIDGSEIKLTRSFEKLSVQPVFGLCLPVNKQYSVTGNNKDFAEYPVEISIGSKFFTYFIIPSHTSSTTESIFFQYYIDFNLTAPNVFFNDNFYSYTIPKTVEIIPSLDNIVSSCDVAPLLPAGLLIDRRNCTIYGETSVISPKKSYTITASNGAGRGASAIITIEVIDCGSSGKIGYKITYDSGSNSNDNSWAFETTTLSTISSSNDLGSVTDNNVYYLNGCAPNEQFQIILQSSSNSPWSSTSLLTIEISGGSSFTFRKSNNLNQEVIPLSIKTVISPAATWKMKETVVNRPDWYKLPYSELTDFKTGILNEAPLFVGATMYLSTQFESFDHNEYSSIFLNITHNSGILIYINGNEFYRKFLPRGQITYNTLATGSYGTSTLISLILPTLYFKDGFNTLSIEIHRQTLDDTTTQLIFNCISNKIEELNDGCFMISSLNLSKIVESSNNPYNDNIVNNAFDYNLQTYWHEKSSTGTNGTINKPYVEIKLPDNMYSWYNQIGWRSVIDLGSTIEGYQPFRIIVQGFDEYSQFYVNLTMFNNIQVYSEGQKFTYNAFANFNLYNKYRFIIDRTKDINSDMRLADLFIGSCLKYYCDSDSGFSATSSGSKTSAPCSSGYVGTMFRKCGDGVNPVWDEIDKSRCRPSPPTNLVYPEKTYILTTYNDLNYIIIPNISFIGKLEYSISDGLPYNLKFNTLNGEITGIPYDKIKLTSFVVSAVDPSTGNGVGTDLNLVISASFCIKDGLWESIEGGEIQKSKCPDGFVGFLTRKCNDAKIPSWGEIDKSGCSDERTNVGTSPLLISLITIFGFIGVCAIGICIYFRFCKSRKRKNNMQSKANSASDSKNKQKSTKLSAKSVKL